MDEIKKNLFNVIHDNIALANVFIFVLFFENYMIISQDNSLLSTTFDFKTISLQPFILFFVFIVLSKILWWIWHFMLDQLMYKTGMGGRDSEIDKKVSVLAFILFILLSVYLGLVFGNQKLAPVNAIEHPFWNRAVLAIPLLAVLFCFIISLQGVNYYEEKKTKP